MSRAPGSRRKGVPDPQMRINIGCGSDKWGDIRLDLKKSSIYVSGRTSSANFVADAQNLPFRDNSFQELKAHHILEHLPKWKQALKEWCRVAKRVDIEIPFYSYPPLAELHNLFQTSFVSWSYLRHVLLKLPQRTKEHLWQFNVNVLVGFVRSRHFHVKTELHYWPTFVICYRLKGKFFLHLSELFRRPFAWRIVGSRRTDSVFESAHGP